jgi:hypothetical protein
MNKRKKKELNKQPNDATKKKRTKKIKCQKKNNPTK